MTDTSIEAERMAERAAALTALAATDSGVAQAAPAPITRTGREVEAGGDVPRLLVRSASTLGYGRKDGTYVRAEAIPGDVVLLSAAQAARLDALGVTVDPDADLEEVDELLGDEDAVTDEQLGQMNAADLVAHIAQNPEDRQRVRDLEEARDKPRKTVLEATEAQPEAEASAAAGAAAAADQDGDGSAD